MIRSRPDAKLNSPHWLTDAIFSLAVVGLAALSLLAMLRPPELPLLDLIGVLFLIAAGSYRGTIRVWWYILTPLALVLLFAPIVHGYGSTTSTALDVVLRVSFIPMMAFCGGQLLVAILAERRRLTDQHREKARIEARIKSDTRQLKRLASEFSKWVSRRQATSRVPEMQSSQEHRWQEIEIKVSDRELAKDSPDSSLTMEALKRVVRDEMNRLSAACAHRPGLQLKCALPGDFSLPLAVRGSEELLATVTRALLLQAVRSLGEEGGLVRLGVYPGLRTVSMTVEDNGRGLNELFTQRLEDAGLLERHQDEPSLRDLRAKIAEHGWKLEMSTRLGVGARVMLELPRSDVSDFRSRRENMRFVGQINDQLNL